MGFAASPMAGPRRSPGWSFRRPGLGVNRIAPDPTGSAIREGIGQTLVYAIAYDFVIYAFYDTTAEKRVSQSASHPVESAFIADLWEHHNVRFEVI